MGEIEIEKRPVIGDNYEHYLASVLTKYRGNDILIEQAVTKIDYENCGPSRIEYRCEISTSSSFNLYMYKRGFIDKVFGKRGFKSKNPEFDEVYVVKSRNISIAERIFANEEIQSLFLKNSLLILNISTADNITMIRFRDQNRRLYSYEEMIRYLEVIKHFINCILKESDQ